MRKLAAFRVMPGRAVPTVNEINNKNSRIITYSLLCLRRIVCRFLFKQHTSCPPLSLCCASNYHIICSYYCRFLFEPTAAIISAYFTCSCWLERTHPLEEVVVGVLSQFHQRRGLSQEYLESGEVALTQGVVEASRRRHTVSKKKQMMRLWRGKIKAHPLLLLPLTFSSLSSRLFALPKFKLNRSDGLVFNLTEAVQRFK